MALRIFKWICWLGLSAVGLFAVFSLYVLIMIAATVQPTDFIVPTPDSQPTSAVTKREEVFVTVNKKKLALPMGNDCQQAYCIQKKIHFSQIPSSLWKGLMGIEDTRFLEHQGVDPLGIIRALWIDLRQFKFAQGASTITQQLVRNLYLSREKSLWRKFREILLSVYVEMTFSKEEILQSYFNEITWGSLAGVKLKGVYAASYMYFQKHPYDLTSYEAAILIAMLKGPYYYHPLTRPEELRQRSNLVFQSLLDKNFFSQFDQSQLWKDDRWSQWLGQLKQLQENRDLILVAELIHDKYYHDDWSFAFALVKSADSYLQKLRSSPQLEGQDLAFKLFVKNPFEDAQPFFYYSKIERDYHRAWDKERHQLGSILKPLWTRALRDLSIDWGEKFSTKPVTFQLKSGRWTPRESYQRDETELSLEQTLQLSRNIPMMRAIESVGFDSFERKILLQFPDLKTPLREFPAQLLGALELPFSEVARVFSEFINQECLDVEEGVLSVADTVLARLSDPKLNTLQKVVGTEMSEQKFFAKTGTSNNAYDNWLVAYWQGKIVIIWVGIESGRRNDDSAAPLPLSGAATAYRIFEQAVLSVDGDDQRQGCLGI